MPLSLAHVPVLGADPPLAPRRRASGTVRDTAAGRGLPALSWLYQAIVVLTVLVFLQALLLNSILFKLGVLARYLLWAGILVGTAAHVARGGGRRLVRGLLPVLPFMLCGLISSLVNSDLDAMRWVVIWLLGMMAAATIGSEVDDGRLLRLLFWTFGVLIALSIVTVFAFPSIGVLVDTRALDEGNAWRGVFQHKNMLGFVCSLTIASALLAPGLRWFVRAPVLLMALVCTVFSSSGGASIIVATLLLYLLATAVLRRLPVSPATRAILLISAVVLAGLVLWFGAGAIVELTGRDATLTGRADIWPVFFNRALDHWLIGAGPGTFTALSFTTVDLTAELSRYGAIHTPHNFYIAAFGEVGVLGFIAVVGALLFFALVVPFASHRATAQGCGAFALILMVGGVSETREVFGIGISMFLILLLYSAQVNRTEPQAASAIPVDADPVEPQARGPFLPPVLA